MKAVARIAVIGPNTCSEEDYALGLEVGKAIAARGGLLICGGLGGIMEAAAKGAKQAGGLTLGLLPGDDAHAANEYIDVPLPTGLGAVRNALVARSSDAVIAVRGAYGTLSEIAFALRLGVPVIGLHTWSLMRDGQADPGIHVATTPGEAVDLAFRLAQPEAPGL